MEGGFLTEKYQDSISKRKGEKVRMKRKRNSFIAGGLAALMVFSCIPAMGTATVVSADENNLAQGKQVTASHSYSTMGAELAVDGDLGTRWASEGDNQYTGSLTVDLGSETEFNQFKIYFEKGGTTTVTDFVIEGSNTAADAEDFQVIYDANENPDVQDAYAQVDLSEAVNYRYVRITATVSGYPSVSLREFEIYNVDRSVQDPQQNVALGMTAYSSSNENTELTAAKAFDGDTSTRTSRWSSNVGNPPHWLYVDLGQQRDIKTVRIFWETRKATNYEIQISDDASDWQPVKELTERPASTTDTITLHETVHARYVRLYINASDAEDPDSDGSWNSISVYEMEVYGGTPAVSMGDIGNMITVKTPTNETEKLDVTLPKVDGYTVTYNGTDLEQVVDSDLTIYQPVVDKTVNVSFKIVNDETGDYEFKEIPVTIPGQNQAAEGDNAAPEVLPELQEWKGGTGVFTLSDSSRIIYDSEELKPAADEMAADFADLTGREITVKAGSESEVNEGDFFFTTTEETSLGLMDEGYLMDISGSVKVTSKTETGAYWATRTILQALKQSDYKTIPQGTTRDYPLYEVRGFILDVGRKTFTMDYLEQVVKEMSWYKMNDFQVHLNDNLIGLENKEDPMTAYSAFRLENDTVKEGGYLTDAEGNVLTVDDEKLQYEQDLTSTDLWYTKEKFKKFIQESRELGVNIVPEIDTPAHSLALTKVLPELRYGTSGRQNDHLDLVDSYDQCLTFVQTIFSEYLDEGVFDQDTIVHIGADEYNASSEKYREFVNDMIHFVEKTGRQARVWGSFTQAAQGEKIDAEGVQINLWNFGYANMDQMYEDGFDLINCNDGNYYIVPNAGYYYDYLGDGTMYNLAINSIGGVTIPAGDKQMVGGAFAVWNDMTDYLDNGVSEYDVYDRISNLSLFAAKLWGKGSLELEGAQERAAELGDAPRTNFGYDVDSENDEYMNLPMDELEDTSANNFNVGEGENAAITEVDGKNALELKGEKSYITTGLETAGLGNDLRVKVKRTSDSTDEQILFESPYGSIKAVQTGTGQVGLSRERFDYSFNYTLPLNEWVELEFKNQQNTIQLYVNGELVDTLGDDERIEGRPMLATMMFPMAKIGSETNAFIGYVDDVRIGVNDAFASTMELDYALMTADSVLDESDPQTAELISKAKAVLARYAPDQTEIESLTAALNELISASEYETADYSRVEMYKELAENIDESAFTEASIAKVESVLASIRYDLPKAMQDTVDGYEAALVAAINALETKPITDLYYVDQSTMTATASSSQGGSGPEKALDGDESTMWHTDWNITTMPHWIDLELSELTEISGLVYTPRQTGTNGNATNYTILVSNDGVTYSEIKTGTLTNDSTTKTIEFDEPVTTKHVRLQYNQAVNNNGSAAELQVLRANISADTEGLQDAIDSARQFVGTLNEEDYTAESWDALQSLLADAEKLLGQASPDANEVAAMIYNIQKAVAELRLVDTPVDPDPDEPVTVDKSDLLALIEKYAGYNSNSYTEETWKPFYEAHNRAKEVYLDDSAVQAEVDAAAKALDAAAKALVKVSEPTDPSKPSGDEGNDGQVTEKLPVTAVQTGDAETMGMIYAVMLIVSFGAVTVVAWRRRVSK